MSRLAALLARWRISQAGPQLNVRDRIGRQIDAVQIMMLPVMADSGMRKPCRFLPRTGDPGRNVDGPECAKDETLHM
jgi:hypothetical protein